MTAKTTVDNSGRVRIPKRLREALNLNPGDAVEIEAAGPALTIRPVEESASFTLEDGISVLSSGTPVHQADINALIDALRDERAIEVLG